MKVLITGSSGFVGQETCKYLTEKEWEIIGFDLMNGGQDITDFESLEKVVLKHKPDRILHLAATARFSDADKNPIRAFRTNAWGTKNIAEIGKKYHIPIVYSSTGSVYMPVNETPPITEEFSATGNSNYACSKRLGELWLMEIANPWIILRYGHLYGAEKRYHGLIGGFISRIERGLEPKLFGGKQSNDFAYVKDIAHANYCALKAKWENWNQIYNIGTGEEITAEDAGKFVCDIMGYGGKIEINKGRDVDPQRFVYDTSKAEHMLGFKAHYTFKDGLEDMLEEMKKQDD